MFIPIIFLGFVFPNVKIYIRNFDSNPTFDSVELKQMIHDVQNVLLSITSNFAAFYSDYLFLEKGALVKVLV